MNELLNNETGEIIERPVIRSMYFNPVEPISLDLSNEIEDSLDEVQPFAIDPNSGDFLNKSSVPMVVVTGKINIQEKIQSYAKDVDMYSILEKFAYSGDTTLLNARPCQYGDISELPDNINDYAKFIDIHLDKLKDMNPELARMVISEEYSPADIEKKALEIANERNNIAKKEGTE